MSPSNERFGRREERDGKLHAEPVLSFTPHDDDGDAGPSLTRDAPKSRTRPTPKDAKPKTAEKAPQPRVADGDRPLYLYLPPAKRRGNVAKAVVAFGVIALAAAYGWHRLGPSIGAPSNADDTLPNLAQPQPLSTYGEVSPSTPTPTTDATPPAAAASAPTPQPPQPVANTPSPLPSKAVASAPPPQPPKPVASAPAPKPPADAAPPALATTSPPPDAIKHDAPRKEASLDVPKRDQAPAPPSPPMQAIVAPPPTPPATAALPTGTQPTTAQPAFAGRPATGKPLPLTRSTPPQTTPPAEREASLPPQAVPHFNAPASNSSPSSAAAAPNAGAPDATQPAGSNTVTVDGVTYVNGEEPHALGTLGGPPAASNEASATPIAPQQPAGMQAPTDRPYAPRDSDTGVAPLPNDVIIMPNGQMAVPAGQQ